MSREKLPELTILKSEDVGDHQTELELLSLDEWVLPAVIEEMVARFMNTFEN